MRDRVHVRACVRTRVLMRVRACDGAHVRVCVGVSVCMYVCSCAWMCVCGCGRACGCAYVRAGARACAYYACMLYHILLSNLI